MVERVFGLSFRRKPAGPADSLESLLAEAAAGNGDAREQLLQSYLPFVDRVVANTCGRSVGRTDDEFQIALLALNEAVDAYQVGRGSFIGFAETVMRRRLIDSFRQTKRLREIPFTAFDEEDDEGNTQNAVEVETALREHRLSEENAARAEEIRRYSEELSGYGLTFAGLVDLTPRHADARESALSVARMIAEDGELSAWFRKHRALPLKQLEDRASVSRKTMERQRNYIVAAVLILLGDYKVLQSFVRKEEGR